PPRSPKGGTVPPQVLSPRPFGKKSYPLLFGSKSWGSISHWHPLRFRYKSVLSTSRISSSRGRPPSVVRGAGIRGARITHWASVKSEGYALRFSCSSAILALSHVVLALCLPSITSVSKISF